MSVLYNEHDTYPAAWLRNLIDAGHIAPGTVDQRSVIDLEPKDLAGVTQFHAFAGIGVWSHALRLAGWPDDAPVWTGSCPCQPFSAAGRRKGHDDERHLWPAWFRLIRECRPPVVFGEQVASGDGLAWLDAVQSDLEGEGYAVGALDLCAAGVGAPHIRQRVFFVAEAEDVNRGISVRERGPLQGGAESRGSSAVVGMAHAANGNDGAGRARDGGAGLAHGGDASSMADAKSRTCGSGNDLRPRKSDAGDGRLMGDAYDARAQGRGQRGNESGGRGAESQREPRSVVHATEKRREVALLQPRYGREAQDQRQADVPGSVRAPGFWSDLVWLPCRDGKARPTQPGLFPLVDGSAFRVGSGSTLEGKSRVGMLRAAGNAIVAPLATEFICAAMEAMDVSV